MPIAVKGIMLLIPLFCMVHGLL